MWIETGKEVEPRRNSSIILGKSSKRPVYRYHEHTGACKEIDARSEGEKDLSGT